MTPADSHRNMAADLLAKAMEAREKPIAVQLEALAQAYIRLAEQADQNSHQVRARRFMKAEWAKSMQSA